MQKQKLLSSTPTEAGAEESFESLLGTLIGSAREIHAQIPHITLEKANDGTTYSIDWAQTANDEHDAELTEPQVMTLDAELSLGQHHVELLINAAKGLDVERNQLAAQVAQLEVT